MILVLKLIIKILICESKGIFWFYIYWLIYLELNLSNIKKSSNVIVY